MLLNLELLKKYRKTLGIYAVGGVSILLLSWILQPYAFTMHFWDLGLVFSIGGATALVAEAWLNKRYFSYR
jgi:hypothetical protein